MEAGPDDIGVMVMSAAISFKRIADAMQPVIEHDPARAKADVDRIAELEDLIRDMVPGSNPGCFAVAHLDHGGITITRKGRETVRIGQ